MSTLTEREVAALAPSAGAVSSAYKLASPTEWLHLGRGEDGNAWGAIRGSGAEPYQIRVDVPSRQGKCTCPSRQRPCKHALALMLLLAKGLIPPGEMPPSFAGAPGGKGGGRKSGSSTPSPERGDRMDAGLQEMRLWLMDQARSGVGNWLAAPKEHFEQVGRRMMDAQLPGITRRLADLDSLRASGEDWQDRCLEALGELWLLVETGLGRGRLPPGLRAEVEMQLGRPVRKADLPEDLHEEGVWLALAQRRSQEIQVESLKTWWARASDGRVAMQVEFRVGDRPFENVFAVGTTLRARWALYPSSRPVRAHLLEAEADEARLTFTESIGAFLSRVAGDAAAQPWSLPALAVLRGVQLTSSHAVDGAGHAVPAVPDDAFWRLLALTGNAPADVAGLWDGHSLELSSWIGPERVVPL